MSKIRKWKDNYVQLGCTCNETTGGLRKPQCILCNVVFSNGSLKPCKLRDHFNNQNGGADVSGHDVKSLKAKIVCFKTRGTLPLTNHF